MPASEGDASRAAALRRAFERYVRAQLPRVLTQMDRDPDSPTFGSFDRPHWHYKVHDFPSAILQQGAFALEAIRSGTVALPVPPAVIDSWCVAAVNALGRQVGRRGSVDEYYPFERSSPARRSGCTRRRVSSRIGRPPRRT